MSKKTSDVHLRSDRMLVVALAVILAAASAAVGAAASSRPHTDQITARPSVAQVMKPVMPARPVAAAAFVPDVAKPSHPATAADLAMAQLLAEHRCLSEVMYYEARGEGTEGQMAVAEVIFHRLRRGHYGHSICAVVYDGAGTHSCQFSFACHGELTLQKSPAAWRRAETLAARILTGETQLGDTTGDAVSFHAASVSPDWADSMVRTVQIGNHVFYKRGRSRAL